MEDRTLRLWDEQGEALAVFSGDSPITCCIVLEGEQIVVAGDEPGRVMFLRVV